MKCYSYAFVLVALSSLISCGSSNTSEPNGSSLGSSVPFKPVVVNDDFIKGVDLSYVNEMESCNAKYYEEGQIKR